MAVPTITATAAGESTRPRTSLSAGFDSFLQLLTSQLRHQDPLSPLDATQFTSQLVQFSTVDQAIRTNSQLERLTGLVESSSLTSALGFIGREVAFSADQVRIGADGGASITYGLAETADQVAITIRDGRGAIVHEGKGSIGAGVHAYAWDGRRSDGARAAPGLYRVEIRATDADGKAMAVDRETEGQVEAIESDGDGLRLVVGGVPVPIERVRAVTQPAADAA